MIESIKNIGAYVKEEEDIEPLECMLTEIGSNDLTTLLIINVKDKEIEVDKNSFYKSILKEALFYQAGRGFLGGGIRLDFYKDSKVKAACEFCEISDRYDEIKAIIEKHIKENDNKSFALIKINGQTPRELFKDKFLEKMYSTMYSQIKGNHVCHICGSKGEAFNNIGYKFYTNDKEVYGNVEGKGKSGVVICRKCLDDIIVGSKYIKENLTSYWLNKNVMFLPHIYDDDIAFVYEERKLNEDGSYTKFIDHIKGNEEEVLKEIGKCKSKAETDIVFYEEKNSAMNVYHVIKSILPSRFTFISERLHHYNNLKLFVVSKYATATKIGLGEVETTPKEKMRFIDAVFTERKIDRNLFFKRAMGVYKHEFLKGKHREFACMYTINKIYNFLVDCDCLKGGWDVMSSYKNYEELFNENPEYFDSNEKKAWYLIGRCYDLMNYYIKKGNSIEGEKSQDRTSLDKNFFFARKFDFKDFIYFSNLLSDKAIKYRVDSPYFQGVLTEAKELMLKQDGKLSFDEAKYLFFFGMDSYFKKDEQVSADSAESIDNTDNANE